MLSRFTSFGRRLWRDQSGLSALEFAIIVPIMLTSLLGAVEVSNGMLADRKVTQVTSTIADLTSQDTNITDSEMNDIFAAGGAVMYPMGATPLKMRVSSVVSDLNGITTVEWSSGQGMAARTAGSSYTPPAGTVQKGGSVILAEVEYRYVSNYGKFLSNGVTITDQFFLRPRRVIKVTRSAS